MSTLNVSRAALALLLASSLPAAAQSGEDAAGRSQESAVVSVEGSARLLELPVGTAAHLCLKANPGLIFGSDEPPKDARSFGAPACEIPRALAAQVTGDRWNSDDGEAEDQDDRRSGAIASSSRDRGSRGGHVGNDPNGRGNANGNRNGISASPVRGGNGAANGMGHANGRSGG